MTQGPPTRLIVLFSLPLLAGNVLQQLYNMVDSVVVRNEVKEYKPHPSATTFLREVYKVSEGDKG